MDNPTLVREAGQTRAEVSALKQSFSLNTATIWRLYWSCRRRYAAPDGVRRIRPGAALRDLTVGPRAVAFKAPPTSGSKMKPTQTATTNFSARQNIPKIHQKQRCSVFSRLPFSSTPKPLLSPPFIWDLFFYSLLLNKRNNVPFACSTDRGAADNEQMFRQMHGWREVLKKLQ